MEPRLNSSQFYYLCRGGYVFVVVCMSVCPFVIATLVRRALAEYALSECFQFICLIHQ